MMGRRRLSDLLAPVRIATATASMRQAVTVSLIFTVMIALASAAAFVVLSRDLRARLEIDARQMAENLAVTYQVSGLTDLKAQIATNAATTRDYSNLYLFVDGSQTTVFGNFNLAKPFIGLRELEVGQDIVLPLNVIKPGETTYLAYGLQIATGWIITARDMRWISDTRAFLIRSVAWGLGGALLMSVVLAISLTRRSEYRIAELNKVLDAVAAGDLSGRYHPPSDPGDDISRVAASINRMLDQLALTMDSLRQVSNDVAHDLRTPLTRLKTRIEPLLLREDLPDDAQAALKEADQEIDRIVKTFNAVLRIAQIEGGNGRSNMAALDLTALCQTVHDLMLPVAEEMGHSFTLTCPEQPVTITGDREMLAQAMVNLVENAFRHCPDPALVTLALKATETGTILTVTDTGPGIPAAERDNILRRYYRLEKSRNTEGSGLGLSLVAAIVRRHNGQLALGDNGPGLRVDITLPKA